MSVAPHIAVLSGALSADSRTERLARWCAQDCLRRGATVSFFRGAELSFPFYRPGDLHGPYVVRFLDALARADGVVLVTPAYHGSVSGLLKNALDYLNELADDARPFLDGRAVGCVSLAGGAQGAALTLATMRTIVHALRGWPTPLGMAVATAETPMGLDGALGGRVGLQLEIMLDQVLSLARTHGLLWPPQDDLPATSPLAAVARSA
ncbi:NADPH-dependent FMN reductase [Rhizohabitans arisaemae]|uniref:NADPH-dependent FMN reductase n=1 Tax=Rhizohabitans arisaemae TaxID=2720610 RepID=UPI0024B03BB3|nr:NAD(P)H-dependent oxidoreductase [Rhizohabitans arisaemae]